MGDIVVANSITSLGLLVKRGYKQTPIFGDKLSQFPYKFNYSVNILLLLFYAPPISNSLNIVWRWVTDESNYP